MKLLFQDFLDEISTSNKVYDCSGGNIILTLLEGEKTIAMRIPTMYCKDVAWCGDSDGINFQLCFSLEENEDRKAEFEIIVDVDRSKKYKIEIERKEIKDLIKDLYKGKWIKDEEELIKLFTRYIRMYIKSYLETKIYILAYCGWEKEYYQKEFFSLTKRGGLNSPYIQDMFGKDVYDMYRKEQDFSDILLKYNQCKELYDIFFSNPVLIGVFAYTIHALVWDYGCEYEKENYDLWLYNIENRDTLFFSVCLYGKDTDKAKVIANILCNVFNSPQNSWTTISTKHHISATSLKTAMNKLRKYSSVPIIVTSKTNHIMKSFKIVKELYRNREAMQLFVYPVYISDTPINADEIVNFNTDSVLLPFSVKDKETAGKLHEQMTVLLFSFVEYLRDKSMSTSDFRRKDDGQRDEWENLMNAQKGFEEGWIESNLPLFLLYAALKFFCNFIKQFQCEEGEKLLSLYRNSIVKTEQPMDSKQQIQKEKSMAEQGMRYLLCLHKLILDSLKLKEEWLWEGTESRGEKERCYYMYEKVWYKRFTEKLEKEKMEPIGIQVIAKILKEYHILKRYKTSTANVIKRKDKYCYVLLADLFDEKVNQWNIPPE